MWRQPTSYQGEHATWTTAPKVRIKPLSAVRQQLWQLRYCAALIHRKSVKGEMCNSSESFIHTSIRCQKTSWQLKPAVKTRSTLQCTPMTLLLCERNILRNYYDRACNVYWWYNWMNMTMSSIYLMIALCQDSLKPIGLVKYFRGY